MISKELLSEVFGIDILEVQNELYKSRLYYSVANRSKPMNRQNRYLNIHELAHKCKEWAFDAGEWHIKSHKVIYPKGMWRVEFESPSEDLQTIHEVTEPEAIFKACEWIMEQNK